MHTFVSVIYVIVCLFLILVVLLQSGKGGGLGSAFGGGGAGQQIFGGAGAGNILTRLTAGSAFLFMALSVWLAFLSSSGDQALDRAVREQAATQEAATAEDAATPTDDESAATTEAEPEAATDSAPEATDADGVEVAPTTTDGDATGSDTDANDRE
ncbi:MAG: preprotein translocase subunit SecG [Polyangiales bacterium]